jgi:hypothetical protein
MKNLMSPTIDHTYYPGELVKTCAWDLRTIAEDTGWIQIPAHSIVLILRSVSNSEDGPYHILLDERIVSINAYYLREVVTDGNYSRI